MKLLMSAIGAMALLWAVSNVKAGDGSAPSYFDAQHVLDNFAKKDNQLARANGYTLSTIRRTANGNIEIHEKETDIFYVMDGSATFIAGGTPVEPKQLRAGQLTAKEISGGQTYELKKGDVVVVPAGQPHWFKQVNGFINYLTVKSIQP